MNNVRGGDLTGTEEYIRRFGWYLDRGLYQFLTGTIFLMLAIVYLMIDKYFL